MMMERLLLGNERAGSFAASRLYSPSREQLDEVPRVESGEGSRERGKWPTLSDRHHTTSSGLYNQHKDCNIVGTSDPRAFSEQR